MPAPVHHARYGPPDRYERPPPAGFCISVFALVKRGSKVLVGQAREHPRWTEDWLPQVRVYDKAEAHEPWTWVRPPSCYLREGEDPGEALARVMRAQVGVKRFEAGRPEVASWRHPSDWYPGHEHWDLTITYPVKVKAKALPAPGAWWEWLEFREPRALKPAQFGWSDDFARAVGLAQGR